MPLRQAEMAAGAIAAHRPFLRPVGGLRLVNLGDTLQGLVDTAYGCALDDAWVPWGERMIATLHGVAGTMIVIDDTTGRIEHLQPHWNHDPQEYLDHWQRYDSQTRFASGLSRSTAYTDTDHLDLDNPSTAAFDAWARSSFDYGHHLGMVVVDPTLDLRAGFCIHRSVAAGHVPADDQARMQALLPHVSSAMALAFRHGKKLTDAYWEGLANDREDPALLIGADGRVLRIGASMAALLSRQDGLDVTAGRLHAVRPGDDAALSAVIGRATARIAAETGATRIARRSGRAPFIVTAYPLPRHRRMFAPAEAAALLVVVDPAKPLATANALIRQAFDLTPREAELAALLRAGHNVESVAAVMAISLATARSHLRRVLEKTGTVRQTELMLLLARLR